MWVAVSRGKRGDCDNWVAQLGVLADVIHQKLLSVLELDDGKWKIGRLRLRPRHDLVLLQMPERPICLQLAVPLFYERFVLFVPDDTALAAVHKSCFGLGVRQKYYWHAVLSLEQCWETMNLATDQVDLSVTALRTTLGLTDI